jgi:hypothetical protein
MALQLRLPLLAHVLALGGAHAPMRAARGRILATGGQWPPIAAPPRALRLRAPLSLRVVPAVPPRDLEPEIGSLRC